LFAKDKLYHFGISAILSAEIGFVAHNHFESSVDGSVLIGFTAGFSSVSFKEIIDSATPGRHSSGKDIIANFLGALAGTAALYLLIK
jgi:VanZ family protein